MFTTLLQYIRYLKNIPLSLAIILLVVTILRIPNFFEPYWYGDEGIYLTIGNALNRGSLMYTDIVDHKTPLIYYLARVPSQFEFRVLLYFWMVVSTTVFFLVAHMFLKQRWAVIISTTLFVLFTTLPWMEGHIPNGELFVMGFVIAGLWLLTKTSFLSEFLTVKVKALNAKAEAGLLLGSGLLLGLGILTKVPALFDAAAVGSIGYLAVINAYYHDNKTALTKLKATALKLAILGVGIVAPLLFSVAYYYALGSGKDYLDFGLLYNFKYAGSWQLGFSNPLLAFFFTLHGKIVFLGIIFVLLTLAARYLAKGLQFALGWFALALVASLLSNRPYPHYFLQVIPPLSLLIGFGVTTVHKAFSGQRKTSMTVLPVMSAITAIALFTFILVIMKVGLYSTSSYYGNFFRYMTGRIDRNAYYHSFNPLMTENYQVAPLIMSLTKDKMFIWGTNPSLYALTKTRPVGRFTVAFHIEDLKVEDQTMRQLKQEMPPVIVVMKNQHYDLPGLNFLLDTHYLPVQSTEHMVIWKRFELKSKLAARYR